MRVDVHAHLWSSRYLDLIEDGSTWGGLRAGVTDGELDARFGLMDAAGIELQVLSATPVPPHLPGEHDAVRAARLVNDEYAELVRRFPGRFRAFAALPLPHADASLTELARCLDELDMVGAAITTSVLGRSLADPAFLPVYAELDRRGSVLFVHPAGTGAESPLITGDMTWSVGAPVEDTIAVARLILDGIPSRFPHLEIIVPHLGGALPMLVERLDRQFTWESPGTPERPRDAIRRMWFDTVAHDHIPALRAAVDSLGADRLVLGTDYPFQAGDAFLEAVTFIQRAGLADADVDRILDVNAASLLG